jgi:hypothetical protein
MAPDVPLCLLAEAVFVSDLQPSEHPDSRLVRDTAYAQVFRLGEQGCVEQVAQEFGDHPANAQQRMEWAREVSREAFDLAGAR